MNCSCCNAMIDDEADGMCADVAACRERTFAGLRAAIDENDSSAINLVAALTRERDSLRAERDEARAECARLRAVAEAARIWLAEEVRAANAGDADGGDPLPTVRLMQAVSAQPVIAEPRVSEACLVCGVTGREPTADGLGLKCGHCGTFAGGDGTAGDFDPNDGANHG